MAKVILGFEQLEKNRFFSTNHFLTDGVPRTSLSQLLKKKIKKWFLRKLILAVNLMILLTKKFKMWLSLGKGCTDWSGKRVNCFSDCQNLCKVSGVRLKGQVSKSWRAVAGSNPIERESQARVDKTQDS